MRSRGSGVRKGRLDRAAKTLASSLLARLARALQSSKVPYLLTGADAVSFYGAPRRSDDKDFVVMTSSSEELRRVVDKLRDEGFDVRRLDVGHNTIFDSGFRIDIKVKPQVEAVHKIRLGRWLWLNITTAENLVLMKLEFWDGKSFESNDALDLMKNLARQRKTLDMGYVRAEALKRRSYVKLSKIEEHLSRSEELMDRQYERLKHRKAFVSLNEL